jgi:lipopolysaccharide transport system ATP-binding protein
MFVRLAFAVATSADPDILVVDEALAVGDGEFARKSFDRILALKDAGKTILFCSHALYQVEALCNTAVWLDQGEVKAIGATADVIVAYSTFLESLRTSGASAPAIPEAAAPEAAPPVRILAVELASSGAVAGEAVVAASRRDDVIVTVRFVADPALPAPSIGVVFSDANGRNICSAGSHIDGVALDRDAEGRGSVRVVFPEVPLLKGEYWLNAYLLCERGIHVYDYANGVARLTVTQDCLEQGVVSLPRQWHVGA